MWEVFAVQLREGWGRGGGSGGELLAKEVDAELFVLFVRNLHVTSSVASGVGRLCAGLAEEVRYFMSVIYCSKPHEQGHTAPTDIVFYCCDK